MKLPCIHFDHLRKHDPFKLFETADALLAPMSVDEILAGKITPMFDQTFRQFGPTAFASAVSMVTWDRSGQHIYAVGPKVAEALRKTDLSGIMKSMVIPKQRAFYIALSDSPWEQWGGTETQWHSVTGIYVRYAVSHNPETLKPELGFMFNVWGAPNERSRSPLDDIFYRFSVALNDCPEDRDLETHFGGSTALTTDDVFGAQALSVFDHPELHEMHKEFSSDDTADKDKQRQVIRNVFRLTMNLILYMGSQGAEIDLLDREPERKKLRDAMGRAKTAGKKKKFQRRLDSIPKTIVKFIGPTMERKLEEAEREASEHTGDGSQRRRHLVRPHWNHYWVGSGDNKKRTPRWIALHERGSADVGRTVTVVRETLAEERVD